MNGSAVTCSCGQPVTDAYACTGCARACRTHLRSVPDLHSELEVALARRARFTDTPGRVGGHKEPPLPYVPALSEVRWVLRNTLTSWARIVLEEKSAPDGAGQQPAGRHRTASPGLTALDRVDSTYPEVSTPQIALWLSSRVEWMRHQEWATDAFSEITSVAESVTRAIDRPPERRYAGRCTCGTPLYATAAALNVRCPGCDRTYDVQDRRQQLLDAAQDVLGTAPEISRALTGLGLPDCLNRLYGYAKRRRLVEHTRDTAGRPLYRLGDALELLQEAS